MLATLSIPPLFTAISVLNDFSTLGYIGGDLALGNPARKIIHEAHAAFRPEDPVACLLSLECGNRSTFGISKDVSPSSWNHNLGQRVVSSEQNAEELDIQIGHLGIYYRLRVTRGLESTKSIKPAVILTHTSTYLDGASISRKLDSCVASLKLRNDVVSLEQLSEFPDHVLMTGHQYIPEHSTGQTLPLAPPPPVTATFVMRDGPWNFIERSILGPRDTPGRRMLVVTGIGGCGKTQLILKFMHHHRSK